MHWGNSILPEPDLALSVVISFEEGKIVLRKRDEEIKEKERVEIRWSRSEKTDREAQKGSIESEEQAWKRTCQSWKPESGWALWRRAQTQGQVSEAIAVEGQAYLERKQQLWQDHIHGGGIVDRLKDFERAGPLWVEPEGVLKQLHWGGEHISAKRRKQQDQQDLQELLLEPQRAAFEPLRKSTADAREHPQETPIEEGTGQAVA